VPIAVASHTLRRILVCDEEQAARHALTMLLAKGGYEVASVSDIGAALKELGSKPYDLVLAPAAAAGDLIDDLRARNGATYVIAACATADLDAGVAALGRGALGYVTRPYRTDEVLHVLRRADERERLVREVQGLRQKIAEKPGDTGPLSEMIGKSARMQEIFRTVRKLADYKTTVLITGESGTGKDLVARAIHYNSLRRERPFVALNCGGVPETLLESELFGHMRGAFTGADANKKGLIEVAEGGTVFLDEIGEMTTTMQVKLLRVLQDRRFRRLGGTEEVQADIRIIAATNQDLQKMVADGRFREDLFYRINVIPMHLPPLRDRYEDIPLLAEHFLSKYAEQMKKPVRSVAHESLDLLTQYNWPGNVRELENVIERAMALEQTAAILPHSLPPHIHNPRAAADAASLAGGAQPALTAPPLPDLGEGFDLEARGEDFYRHYIALALERAGGVQVKAAEMLGMSFRSFRYYAKKFNVR
jgi:two-component system response regulator PilR (NtrC family)